MNTASRDRISQPCKAPPPLTRGRVRRASAEPLALGLLALTMTLGACAPQAPAAAGAPAPSPITTESTPAPDAPSPSTHPAPTASPEEQTTLKFPFCDREMKTQFANKTEGAAFRAIVLFRILPDGKTAEHCYLRVDGDIEWEERSLGNVAEWTYPVEFAGEQRERTVTYRLK